jgi:hypothetical protein
MVISAEVSAAKVCPGDNKWGVKRHGERFTDEKM